MSLPLDAAAAKQLRLAALKRRLTAASILSFGAVWTLVLGHSIGSGFASSTGLAAGGGRAVSAVNAAAAPTPPPVAAAAPAAAPAPVSAPPVVASQAPAPVLRSSGS